MTHRMPTVATLALSLAACAPDDPFERIGYFKDGRPNRVFVIEATGPVTPEEARAHAGDLPQTDGAQTVVYIFEADTDPADPVTGAPDVVAANLAVFESPGAGWRWRYLRAPNGQTAFIDCQTDWQDGHCK